MVTGLKRMVLILPVNGSKALVITEESGLIKVKAPYFDPITIAVY